MRRLFSVRGRVLWVICIALAAVGQVLYFLGPVGVWVGLAACWPLLWLGFAWVLQKDEEAGRDQDQFRQLPSPPF